MGTRAVRTITSLAIWIRCVGRIRPSQPVFKIFPPVHKLEADLVAVFQFYLVSASFFTVNPLFFESRFQMLANPGLLIQSWI